MDDVELVTRCQSGDIEAFDHLYTKYSSSALKTAYLITGNRQFAEDVVQETFIKCFREMNRLKDPKAFKAWFYRILTNLCWRMKPREKVHLSIEALSDQGLDAFVNDSGLNDPMEAKELQKIVMGAVDSLDTPMKAVIILYYFNDLSIKEIAKAMKCLEGTVKSRLYYGRKQLKKIIEKNTLISVYFDQFIEGKEFGYNEKASLF